MKRYKVSGVLFIIGIVIKLTQTFTDLINGNVEKIFSAAVGIIIGIAISIVILGVAQHWLSRYERVVHEMSKSSPAWLCILEAESSYKILSTNNDCITLSKLANGHVVTLMTWPRQLVSVYKESVQASAFKSFEGIAIAQAESNQPTIKMLIYKPSSTILAKPMQSNELDMVISRLNVADSIETMSSVDKST